MKNVISSTAKCEKHPGQTAYPYWEEYVHINGISEYLLHYPSAPEDPVFLHIHGGPGAPASFFAYRLETFPRNYTIVYYDQRGAGKTLLKNPFAKISMDAVKRDLFETVLHLKQIYRKDRICILGHSWGSVLGSAFALEYPEHVSCYIGCGQMYCFRENEKKAYSFLQDAVQKSCDEKVKKRFARLGSYPAERYSLSALLQVTRMRALQGRLGLSMTMDAQARRILRDAPSARRLDIPAFALGSLRSARMMREFWNYDLRSMGYTYRRPVYYIMGDQDRTTPYEIAQEYFGKITSPHKKWYFIPNAGHFAMLNQTHVWRRIMLEIASNPSIRETP